HRQRNICCYSCQVSGVGTDLRKFGECRNMRRADFRQLQPVHRVGICPGEGTIDHPDGLGQDFSLEMALWWRMTSSIMKFRNFSANSGSKSASLLSWCNRLICAFSRSGSLGGKSCAALSRPTFWVRLNRSASTSTRVAAILSMLERMASSSFRISGSVVPVSEDAVES